MTKAQAYTRLMSEAKSAGLDLAERAHEAAAEWSKGGVLIAALQVEATAMIASAILCAGERIATALEGQAK